MKKLFLLVFALGIILQGFSQITLEHAYYFQRTEFWVTDIGNNEFKYVTEDSTGFIIYNLDHTMYMPKVIPPQPLLQPPSYYEIEYLTKSLFDCDSTNIEYALSTTYHQGNYYVYRTDGTLLFERDSVKGPFCAGCGDGSVYTQPIFNTPNGAKLMFFDWLPATGDQDSLYIYSLCGTLPESVSNIPLDNSFVEVFPNPASRTINFRINQPNNLGKFKLTIYNSSFQKVDEATISGKSYQLDLRQKSLSADTYLFDLRTGNKVYQTGKFIVTN